MAMGFSKLWEIVKPGRLQSMELQRVRHDLVTEQQLSKQKTNFANKNITETQFK